MPDQIDSPHEGAASPPPPPRPPRGGRPPRAGTGCLVITLVMLGSSLLVNLVLFAIVGSKGTTSRTQLTEKHVSGEKGAADRIGLIRIKGSIMPPFTERTLQSIDEFKDDPTVKGVVLTVNSPGGLVADSHQIYVRLKELRESGKPIYVSFSSLAASGGYYVSMGAGPEARIFAEPTTWTGSIGVIMPRYDLSGLGQQFGVKSDPLYKGNRKNTLDPFKELTDDDKQVWDAILQESYDRFVQIIDDGRSNLNADQVLALATGQVYTATQAVANGLVDEIGYEDDCIAALQKKLNLTSVDVIEHEHPQAFIDLLLNSQVKQSSDPLKTVLEASVPREMYFFAPGAELLSR